MSWLYLYFIPSGIFLLFMVYIMGYRKGFLLGLKARGVDPKAHRSHIW